MPIENFFKTCPPRLTGADWEGDGWTRFMAGHYSHQMAPQSANQYLPLHAFTEEHQMHGKNLSRA